MTHLCLSVSVCAAVLHAAAAQLPQRPSERLDVAGHWALNEKMSDALPLLPGEAMTRARAAGVVPSAMGRRKRIGGGPDPALVANVRNALRDALTAAATLTIVQSGRTVTLIDAEDRELSIVTDGKEKQVEHRGVRVTAAGRWEAPLFTIRREYEDGTIIVDSYSTFSDPRQLVTISTISNRHMTEKPVIINRVYDPLER
jgi:hypothetical protein